MMEIILTYVCVLPAALTHSTLRTLPASPAQGGGGHRGVQAAAMVTATTATTHQQTADITATRTQHTLRGRWRERDRKFNENRS